MMSDIGCTYILVLLSFFQIYTANDQSYVRLVFARPSCVASIFLPSVDKDIVQKDTAVVLHRCWSSHKWSFMRSQFDNASHITLETPVLAVEVQIPLPRDLSSQEVFVVPCTETQQAVTVQGCSVDRIVRQKFTNKRHKLQRSKTRLRRQITPPRVITSDVRITVGESPFAVQTEFIVDNGITLSIDPGVELRFMPGVGLTVLGMLVANGTRDKPIMMKPSRNGTLWRGVRFRSSPRTFDVRLAGTISGVEGFVQLFNGTSWNVICSTGWDAKDSTVACKQLGFRDTENSNVSLYAAVDNLYWLTNFQCQGTETNLKECLADPYLRIQACPGAAKVKCLGTQPPQRTPADQNSYLSYVNVSSSQSGIIVEGRVPQFEYVTVQDSGAHGLDIATHYSDQNDNPRLYKLNLINNRLAGISINMSYPTESQTGRKVTVDGCIATANGGDGVQVQGRGHAMIVDSALFLNGQNAINSALEAGYLTVDRVISFANSKYSMKFFRQKDAELLSVTLKNSNVTGHWWDTAILLSVGKNSEVLFENNRFWENYNGAVLSGQLEDSKLKLTGNTFTKNHGAVLRVLGLGSLGNLVASNNFFLLNMAKAPQNQSVIEILGPSSNLNSSMLPTVQISNNTFNENTVQSVISVRRLSSTSSQAAEPANITIEYNVVRQNLAPNAVYIEVPGARLTGNILANPVSQCELIVGPYRQGYQVDARNNYWGRSNYQDISQRICDFSKNANMLPVVYTPYMDTDAMQNAVVISNQNFFSGNEIGGVLSEPSNILPKRNDSYIVTKSLLVSNNSRLTIEKGAILQFQKERGLRVDGLLIARGTPEAPIILRGIQLEDWMGLMFQNVAAQEPSILEHVLIDSAEHGLALDSDKVRLYKVTITHSSGDGVQMSDRTGPVDFGGSQILYSGGHGLHISNSKTPVILKNAAIQYSMRHGIELDNPVTNISLENLLITSSGGYAVHIDQMMHSRQTINLHNMTIANHKGVGGIYIQARDYQLVNVSQSRFANNSVPSLYALLNCNYTGNEVQRKPPIFYMINNRFVNNTNLVGKITLNYCTSASVLGNQFVDNNKDNRNGVFELVVSPAKEYGKENFLVEFNQNDFIANQGDFSAYILPMSMYPLQCRVTGNNFTENSNLQGVFIVGAPECLVNGNRFVNTGTYNLVAEYNDGRTLDARNNWWGTGVEGDVEKSILDGRTINTRGLVIFRPFAPQDTLIRFNCTLLRNCNGKGACIADNRCNCYQGYLGQDCGTISCLDVRNCSSNGRCVDVNACQCFDGWLGPQCSIPSCINLANCTEHGECVSKDECRCFAGYQGSNCSERITTTTPYPCAAGCENYGRCVGGTCICDIGWSGRACDVPTCRGVSNCSNAGACIAPDLCRCISGFSGPACSVCELDFGCDQLLCKDLCVYGRCNAAKRLCDCEQPWTGASCNVCRNATTGQPCQLNPQMDLIFPNSAPANTSGVLLDVVGQYLARTVNNSYTCQFNTTLTRGRWLSSKLIQCPVPILQAGDAKFSITPNGGQPLTQAGGRDLFFKYTPACSAASCGPNAVCFQGSCLCVQDNCGAPKEPPKINVAIVQSANATSAREGVPYAITLTTEKPDQKVRWVLIKGPSDMTVDPLTGLVSWPTPVGQLGPTEVTVAAVSENGTAQVAWNITVPPSYKPDINGLYPKENDTFLVSGKNIIYFWGYTSNTSHPNGTVQKPVPVKIGIYNNGILVRVINTTTDEKGFFNVSYVPTPNEAGEFVVIAVHPSQTLNPVLPFTSRNGTVGWATLGFTATPDSYLVVFDERNIATFRLAITNTGKGPLSNFQIGVVQPSSVRIENSTYQEGVGNLQDTTNIPNIANFTLAPNHTLIPAFRLNMAVPELFSGGPLRMYINTAEGVRTVVSVAMKRLYGSAYLKASPPTIRLYSSVQAANENAEILIDNIGDRTASNLSIQFGQDSPLFVIAFVKNQAQGQSSQTVSLGSLDSATLVLGVLPKNVPLLGGMTGKFTVQSVEGSSVTISYELQTQQQESFDFTVRVEDENTYLKAESPLVGGATIRLESLALGFRDTRTTNTLTPVTFQSILSGLYELYVDSPNHEPWFQLIKASHSQDTNVVFLTQKMVNRTVTIAESEDITPGYKITVTSTSNAKGPIPVLKIAPLDLVFPINNLSVNFELENQGNVSVTYYNLSALGHAVYAPVIIEPTIPVDSIQPGYVTVIPAVVRPNPIFNRSAYDCDAYWLPVDYISSVLNQSVARTVNILLKKESYDIKDIAICSIDRNTNSWQRSTTDHVATSTLVFCDCTTGRQSICTHQYVPAGGCGQELAKLGSHVGLDTIIRLSDLVATCSSTGVNLHFTSKSIQCLLDVPINCPSVQTARVLRDEGSRLSRFFRQVKLVADVQRSIGNPLQSILPFLLRTRQRAAAADLPKSNDVLKESREYLNEIGDITEPFRLQLRPGLWYPEFKRTIGENIAFQSLLTLAQYERILSQAIPGEYYDVAQYLQRWNQTVYAWSEGKNVGSNEGPIIEFREVASVVNLTTTLWKLRQQEFNQPNPLAVTDSIVAMLKDTLDLQTVAPCAFASIAVKPSQMTTDRLGPVKIIAEINNFNKGALQAVALSLALVPSEKTALQTNATFEIGLPTISGIASLDARNELAEGKGFTAEWTARLRTGSSALLRDAAVFHVQPLLSFTPTGKQRSVMLLLADDLTLFPKPELDVQYFIFPVVSPARSITYPYNILLKIRNTGSLRIDSLRVSDWRIKTLDQQDMLKMAPYTVERAYLNNVEMGRTLAQTLGNLEPNRTIYLTYLLTSTISAILQNATATFIIAGDKVIQPTVSKFVIFDWMQTDSTDRTTIAKLPAAEVNMIVGNLTNEPVVERVVSFSDGTSDLIGRMPLIRQNQISVTRGNQVYTVVAGEFGSGGVGRVPFGQIEIPFTLNNSFQLLEVAKVEPDGSSVVLNRSHDVWVTSIFNNQAIMVNFMDYLANLSSNATKQYHFFFGSANAEAPKFSLERYQTSVNLDNVQPNSVILTVAAQESTPGKISYSLYGGGGAFAVDSNTGEVVVADNNLLMFSNESRYCLNVKASDDGVPTRYGIAPVEVEITGTGQGIQRVRSEGVCGVFPTLDQMLSFVKGTSSNVVDANTSRQTVQTSNNTQTTTRIVVGSTSTARLTTTQASSTTTSTRGSTLFGATSNTLNMGTVTATATSTLASVAATSLRSTGSTADQQNNSQQQPIVTPPSASSPLTLSTGANAITSVQNTDSGTTATGDLPVRGGVSTDVQPTTEFILLPDPSHADFEEIVMRACRQASVDKVYELACEIGKIHLKNMEKLSTTDRTTRQG